MINITNFYVKMLKLNDLHPARYMCCIGSGGAGKKYLENEYMVTVFF